MIINRIDDVYQDGYNYEVGGICSREEVNKIYAGNGLGKKWDLVESTSKCKGEMKVIFNYPATILFINGKKYVSKVHVEPFDEEKGLLMCLAKANGINHLELKRMIEGAKRPKTGLSKEQRLEGVMSANTRKSGI